MSNRLTGKTKYRIHKPFLGDPLLVLMVEEYRSDGPPDFHGMPTYLAGFWWRDAKVEDLSFVAIKLENDTSQIS